MAIIYSITHPRIRGICETSAGLPRVCSPDPKRQAYLRRAYAPGTVARAQTGAAETYVRDDIAPDGWRRA